VEENKQEFDFASSNARFEKATANSYAGAAASSSSAAPSTDSSVPSYELPAADSGLDTSGFPVVTVKYDKKKSFFDELSQDGNRQPIGAGRMDVRRHDMDTFGEAAQHFRSKHGRGGRGHGHGHSQGQGGQGHTQGQGQGQGQGQRRNRRGGGSSQGQWRGDGQ
jgi:hypothetical protein